MNIIYETSEHLPIYKERDLERTDLSIFFSTHKKSFIFVTDEKGTLTGYIDHMHYKRNLGKNELHPQPIETIVEKEDIPNINLQELFTGHPSCEAIPVMNKGIMTGAFFKNYSEELMAYDRLINKIALNALQYFKGEATDYLLTKNINKISFIGPEEDRDILKQTLKDIITILPKGDYTGKLIIDTIHSKSYRGRRNKSTNATYSLEELLTLILIPIVKNYCKEHDVTLHIYEGPLPEKLHSATLHGLIKGDTRKIDEALGDDMICKHFSVGNSKILSYLRDENNGPLRDNYVTTNGLHLLMGIANRGKNVSPGNCIHLYGSCLTYGMCVPAEFTVSAIMKSTVEAIGYEVINHGVKNGHSLMNDFLYLLNTPFTANDHVVIINAFSQKVSDSLKEHFQIQELSDILNQKDDSPWYYLDNTFHLNHIANQIIAECICRTINNTSPKHAHNTKARSYIEDRLKTIPADPDKYCEELVLGTYKEYLLTHKHPTKDVTVGAVLLTANPITKGHEHLIKYAKAHCDILYVFIVEEDLFFFSTAERMMLTYEIVSDPNIVIVSTGSMMTAKFTFPEYFTKTSEKHEISPEDISNLHCEIFGRLVCPILGITVRFVGEEIGDSVTKAYNLKLQTILPMYGVKVVEIPRLQTKDSIIISSSSVRKAIENKEFEKIKAHVSEPVEKYIKAKWNVKN